MKRVALVTVLLLVVGFVGYNIVRSVTAKPAPIVNYAQKVMDLSNARQPDVSTNGWKHLLDAHAAFDAVRAEMLEASLDESGRAIVEVSFGFEALHATSFDPDDLEMELAVLEALAGSGMNEHLELLAESPRIARTIPSGQPLIQTLLPMLAVSRQLAKARLASMRLAIDRGDHPAALDAFEQTLALGRAAGSQHFLIDWLVAVAIDQFALRQLRIAMITRPDRFDALACRDFAAAIDRQAHVFPAEHWLEGERLGFMDTVQVCFTDDGHGSGRLDMQKMGSLGVATMPGPGGNSPVGRAMGSFSSIFVAGRRETVDAANEFYENLKTNAKMSPAARTKSSFSGDQYVESLSPRHVFLRMMLPAIEKSITHGDSLGVAIEGTRLMLAIESYRADTGALPPALDALVPAYLEAVPVDPIHGDPFVYRIAESEPAGYILYSTGLDRTDDGGNSDGSGGAEALMPRGKGLDFVLTELPEDQG